MAAAEEVSAHAEGSHYCAEICARLPGSMVGLLGTHPLWLTALKDCTAHLIHCPNQDSFEWSSNMRRQYLTSSYIQGITNELIRQLNRKKKFTHPYDLFRVIFKIITIYCVLMSSVSFTFYIFI